MDQAQEYEDLQTEPETACGEVKSYAGEPMKADGTYKGYEGEDEPETACCDQTDCKPSPCPPPYSKEARIENNFSYHPPNETRRYTYKHLRAKMKSLAYDIERLCPDSREKSIAMTKLEEASMWANAAIARN